MEIEILQLIEGARRARGLAVIIDVFRAFSVECWAFSRGAKRILPVAGIDEAFALKRANPGALLVGERGGRKCEGFDCGNSPSQLEAFDVCGRVIVHTTSAGTQGIANAAGADEIAGASLVNAAATAEYIRRRNPAVVSLVCMGLDGVSETDEDTLCADYIAALLRGESPDISQRVRRLSETSGKKFFNPDLQEVFPRRDFEMCTQVDRFPYALRVRREGQFCVEKIEIK